MSRLLLVVDIALFKLEENSRRRKLSLFCFYFGLFGKIDFELQRLFTTEGPAY